MNKINTKAAATCPYSEGVSRENWMRGYTGARFIGYAKSPAHGVYLEGRKARPPRSPKSTVKGARLPRRSELIEAALVETQSLLAAMLHESRPTEEIEDQMIQNRLALLSGVGGAGATTYRAVRDGAPHRPRAN